MTISRFAALLLSTALLGLAGCETGPTVDPDDLEDQVVEEPTWSDDIQPMMVAYCGSCHEGAATASGGIGWLNSHEEVTTAAFAGVCAGGDRADCIPIRLEDGSMPDGNPCPPGEEGCITDNQFTTLENWIDNGKPE